MGEFTTLAGGPWSTGRLCRVAPLSRCSAPLAFDVVPLGRHADAAQIIAELIELAKDMRKVHERGEVLGLSEEELAFYDALETNDCAVKVLGDDTLKTIACKLVQAVRRNVTIDWTVKESIRARLRVLVRRILRKYGYPPDKQERATQTVLEQAERIAEGWAA